MEGGVNRHRVRAVTFALLIVVLGAGATAPGEAARSPAPVVDIQTAGGVAPDGGSITLQVLASCPERWRVVEAVVAVSQPQASGRGSFPLTCTGGMTMFSVVAPATVGTFALGDAEATASVTIQRGRTERVQDAQSVQVQPIVLVDLGASAALESGGGAVVIDVGVACPTGATGAGSYVNVSQGQTASGNGTYVPICDGRQHTFAVRVQASQGLYRPGSAQALTFANVVHDGLSFAGVDEGPVQLVS
jgi:hypothetical protein